MNIYIEEKLAQQRRREWLRSAERGRQVKAARFPGAIGLLSLRLSLGAGWATFVRRLRAGERQLGGSR